jgi:Zn-dependent peptidase ImmA (M78 family)
MSNWKEFRKEKLGAVDILLDLGIIYPPINTFLISSKLNIKIFEGDFADNNDASINFDELNPKIIINRKSTKDNNFIVAHMLGHLFADTVLSNYNCSINCIKANAFACDLILPKDFIIANFPKSRTPVADLAKIFNVSFEAMLLRLESSGLKGLVGYEL